MDTPDPVLYRTRATATGGRNGKTHLDEGGLWIATSIPKDMGGDGQGSNPEQLFALGYASCFGSALLFVAGQKKIDASRSKVSCDVGIGRAASGGFALDVILAVSLPGLEADVTRDLVEAAHQVCPYSNATRGNINVTLQVTS